MVAHRSVGQNTVKEKKLLPTCAKWSKEFPELIFEGMIITKSTSEEIGELRELFLGENRFQFIHNKCHEYGWADVYLFKDGSEKIGYGSIWGTEKREERDTVFECFLINSHKHLANDAYRHLVAVDGVRWLECQTNDPLLSRLFFEHAKDIQVQSLLFEDSYQTRIEKEGLSFRKKEDKLHHSDDSGAYVLENEQGTVATGGFMLNYNFPYADIYMEVEPGFQRQGYGSYLVQELKKEIYKQGRVPSARCNPDNLASRNTLRKAGFEICGALLLGAVKK
jgi:RimJ/RimL family protein N-acetyltransferase